MSRVRMSIAAAWLLSLFLYCGCSGGGSVPSTPQTGGNSSPLPAHPVATPGQASAPPSASGQAPSITTVPSVAGQEQNPAKDLVAQIKELQAKPLQQPRSASDLKGIAEHF